MLSFWYHKQGAILPDVLIRNLDPELLASLKAAAKMRGRSLQAEIHDILRRAGAQDMAGTRRLSAQWLKRLGRSAHTDSAALIREDRDAR